VLYGHWRSSSSHRVRIALALKGRAYTYAAVDLRAGEQAREAHGARSPTGYVPCLVLDGAAYVESVAIVELIEERFPSPPLFPRDAHARARVRAIVEIVNSGVQPLHNLSVLRFQSPDAAEQKAWAAHFIQRGLGALERTMEVNAREGIRGPFAYGDQPTAADVFLVPQGHAAARFGVGLSPFPRVAAAFETASRLEAFRLAAPELQPDAPPRENP